MLDFVADIESDFPHQVIEGTLCDNYSIEFRLGFRFDIEKAILMSVTLLEGFSDLAEEGVFDLRFGIREQCLQHTWNVEGMDFGRGAVAAYIAKSDRPVVLALLGDATRSLVAHVRPRIVTMSTFDRELPPKALIKYGTIEGALAGLGYRLSERYRSEDARDRWQFVAAT